MSIAVIEQPRELLPEAVEQLLATGDLKQLTTAQRIIYYQARCAAAGLDPRTRPFEYISMQGKLVLYALKSCTDSLAGKHGLSFDVISQSHVGEAGMYQVIGRVRFPDGRETTDMGVVPVKGLSGADLANAMMKAVTKAKRRATLSACGLGDVMDETELETCANVRECLPSGEIKALDNQSGFASGMYASEEQADVFLRAMDGFLGAENQKWLDFWSLKCDGEIPKEVKEVCNRHQADNHLIKWAMETGRLDPQCVDDRGLKNRQIGRFTAIIYHRDKESRGALARELRRYVEEQTDRQMEGLKIKRPDLFVDDTEEEDTDAALDGMTDDFPRKAGEQ